MAFSRIELLLFCLHNPATFSLEPKGPLPFLFDSITRDVPQPTGIEGLSSKTVLITGGTSGCGFAAAKDFARYGACVVITARDRSRGEEARIKILKHAPQGRVSVMDLDMALLSSVLDFVKNLEKAACALDIVILNAGAYYPSFETATETGFELTTQVHVLSTFLLAKLLIPFLERSAKPSIPSRLFVVSSEAHAWVWPKEASAIEIWKNLNEKDAYPSYIRYHTAQLLKVLFVRELSGRVDTQKVLVATGSPGYASTGLFRGARGQILASIIDRIFSRSPEHAAWAYERAILAPGSEFHGVYFSHGCAGEVSRYCLSVEGWKMQKDVWDVLEAILEREAGLGKR